jgi:hypothetical protein
MRKIIQIFIHTHALYISLLFRPPSAIYVSPRLSSPRRRICAVVVYYINNKNNKSATLRLRCCYCYTAVGWLGTAAEAGAPAYGTVWLGEATTII